MATKQRTILKERAIQGKSLHTGEEVTMTLKPAAPNTGFLFRRVDLYGKPEIKPLAENTSDLVRSTTITDGNAKVHTIEHVLSALAGCGIDNAEIELDASEPPIMDGSSRPFVNLIMEAEPLEQEEDRKFLEITEPVSVTSGNRSIIALPHDGFRVTCTSADDRGIHVQHLSIDIDPETYVAQIAPARTFTIYEEIEELIKIGKIQGAAWTVPLSSKVIRFSPRNLSGLRMNLFGIKSLISWAIFPCLESFLRPISLRFDRAIL